MTQELSKLVKAAEILILLITVLPLILMVGLLGDLRRRFTNWLLQRRITWRRLSWKYLVGRKQKRAQSLLDNALIRAVLSGHQHNVEIFLKRGGDPNAR